MPSDYVMVVDTSMGFNKVSVAMQQAMQYTVTLATDRAPQAELTIAYTNTNPPAPGCVHRPPEYDLDTTYEQLVQQCYWLYRRVLAPPGAELIDASRHPTGPGELVNGLNERWRDACDRGRRQDRLRHVLDRAARPARGEPPQLHAARDSVVLARGDQLSYHLVWQKAAGRGRLADNGDRGVSGGPVPARGTTAAQPYDGQLGHVSI